MTITFPISSMPLLYIVPLVPHNNHKTCLSRNNYHNLSYFYLPHYNAFSQFLSFSPSLSRKPLILFDFHSFLGLYLPSTVAVPPTISIVLCNSHIKITPFSDFYTIQTYPIKQQESNSNKKTLNKTNPKFKPSQK